jgi:hypothetical protein
MCCSGILVRAPQRGNEKSAGLREKPHATTRGASDEVPQLGIPRP